MLRGTGDPVESHGSYRKKHMIHSDADCSATNFGIVNILLSLT